MGHDRRTLAIFTAVMAAVIAFGSLYPFAFQVPAGPGPLHALWRSRFDPLWQPDFLSNILFYMPLGYFLVGTLLRCGAGRLALPAAVVGGVCFSTAMELLQYYDAGRETAVSDIEANTLGAAAGALLGLALESGIRRPVLRQIAAGRIPALLVAVFLLYRLYPYVPLLDPHKYWQALQPFLHPMAFSFYGLIRLLLPWLALAALLAAIAGDRRAPAVWLLVAALVFAGSVTLENRALRAPDVAGAALAIGLWLALARVPRWRLPVVTVLLGLGILAWRLAPFEFVAAAQPFHWRPFHSLVFDAAPADMLAFLQKFYLFGSLIWLTTRIGLRLAAGTVGLAAVLFATALIETHIAGRSADITDAVLALLLGITFALLDPAKFARAQGAPPPAA